MFFVSGLTFALGKKVGRKLYLTNGQRTTFDRAKAQCSHFQASMAVPMNAEENEAIMYVTKGDAFLGITDKETEGHFVDLTGRPLTYQNWNAHEPNNANSGEDCVIILPEGMWNDVSCSSSYLVVCEFEFPVWGSPALRPFCPWTSSQAHSMLWKIRLRQFIHTQYWCYPLWGTGENKNGLKDGMWKWQETGEEIQWEFLIQTQSLITTTKL